MGSEDAVARALRLIVEDDRRRPDDEDAVARHWRKEFASVSSDDLLDAVATWLRENPRGRPNVGKLWEVIRKKNPAPTKRQAAWDEEIRHELGWAVSVLENPRPFEHAHYRHTLDYAEKCLRRHGHSHWHDAKAFLNPGWTPVTVTDIYL